MISSTNSIKIIRMTKIPKEIRHCRTIRSTKGENDPERFGSDIFVVKIIKNKMKQHQRNTKKRSCHSCSPVRGSPFLAFVKSEVILQ